MKAYASFDVRSLLNVSILIYLEVKNEDTNQRRYHERLRVSILIYLEVKNEATFRNQ